ncbi:hypothetical protein JNB11_06385 [Kocuria palustris]|nr:hypothetical protein [Kocuria palustris]
MKTVVDTTGAQQALSSATDIDTTTQPPTIATPQGRVLLDIQGVLNGPLAPPPPSDPAAQNFITVDDIHTAVKFGRVEFNGNRVTMYIGQLQRLEGQIVPLKVPLGVLRVDDSISMVDVVKHKLTFTDRPLPIM